MKATDSNMDTFEGYASYFNNVDSYGEVIQKGAFKKTLNENADRIKVLYQHRTDMPIGKPLEMYEDDKGLYVKAKVSMTDIGKDVLTLIKDGVINEMSIGFDIVKDEVSNKIRYLKEIRLWEFSPVTFGANDKAKITGVKELNELLYQVKHSDKEVLNQAITYLKSLVEPNPITQQAEEAEEILQILSAIKNMKK
jgi:HK97 family phage prohead protease